MIAEMNTGKLVRDRIPEIIRESGGVPSVAVLREELADLRQVISALMTVCGISDQEVTGVAVAKAEELGAFDLGAWLVSREPEH
jgi:predicted house-cleaning noncanonical NTP pyrophosphatase (MazG superfamily)